MVPCLLDFLPVKADSLLTGTEVGSAQGNPHCDSDLVGTV